MSLDSQVKKSLVLLIACAVLGAAGLGTAPDAHAAKRRGQHHVQHRVKFEKSGSAETVGERERRLARECRGRPNAGACLGFGQ